MKQNIFYAVCIAVIAMSCDKAEQSSALKNIEFAIPSVDPAATSSNKEKEGMAVLDTTSITIQSANDSVLQSGGPGNIDWDKKIIKTAHVTLELKDYNAYNNGIHARLKAYGAYVAQEQQSETDAQNANEITIRVPVDRFDDLMNTLGGDGIKVLEKNISTADVTGEVVDTKSRIEAKKQVRAKYLELLRQAKNMEELLQVQNEVNAIQEDIESATGRVNYLVHSSAYSTINLKYYQYLNGLTSKDVEPGFFSKLNVAFESGASVIMNLVLFFISIWPLVIVAIILLVYVRQLKLKKTVK
jgi:hypothetical protein